MRRPTVLHCVEHWSLPSERFVVDTVRSCTATRAVVATQHRHPGSVGSSWPGRVWDLGAAARRTRVPVQPLLAAAALGERAAVVHAHFGVGAHRWWRVAARLGRPFGVSLHGWDLLVGAADERAIVATARGADLVVVPSRFLADAATAAGVPAEAVKVVPSGVDLATIPFRERQPPAATPLVVFAGRFAPKKGVLDVARAMAAVAAQTPLRARFVGFGPQEDELRRLLADLRLDAEVVDGRPDGAVRDAIAAADVVVTGSRTAPDGDAETLGLVNLEAQASGAPLVTTRHGGIPEAVSAEAVLVDVDGDIAAGLAAGLRSVLDDPGSWARRGRAGREHVATRYELGARTADLESLWLALAAGRRGAELPDPAEPAPPGRTSVVLVTHNRAGLLTGTLDALAAQTAPADEVIVVDNGSTDGTAAILAARAAAQDPPGLTVISRDDNRPVAESRNVAVAAAGGDVVAFTDDDCRPRPTWLEALRAGFTSDVGVVQGRTTADPAQPLLPLSRTQWTPAEFGLYETCNIAYRRSALDAAGPPAPAGPFDLDFAATVAATLGERWAAFPFGEDTELGWRVRRRGVGTRFAVHAVVDHEVWSPDPALVLRRAALAEAFPVLVGRIPELRETFLWHGVVLGPHRARMWLATAAAAGAVATRDPRWLALAAPYAARVVDVRALRRPGHRRMALRAAPVVLRRDLAETVALLRGSLRARTLVV